MSVIYSTRPSPHCKGQSPPPPALPADPGLDRLLADPGLTSTAKAVAVALVRNWAWRRDHCWPSDKTIAAAVGRSVGHVQRCLRALEHAGWVGREHTAEVPNGRVLRLLWRRDDAAEDGAAAAGAPRPVTACPPRREPARPAAVPAGGPPSSGPTVAFPGLALPMPPVLAAYRAGAAVAAPDPEAPEAAPPRPPAPVPPSPCPAPAAPRSGEELAMMARLKEAMARHRGECRGGASPPPGGPPGDVSGGGGLRAGAQPVRAPARSAPPAPARDKDIVSLKERKEPLKGPPPRRLRPEPPQDPDLPSGGGTTAEGSLAKGFSVASPGRGLGMDRRELLEVAARTGDPILLAEALRVSAPPPPPEPSPWDLPVGELVARLPGRYDLAFPAARALCLAVGDEAGATLRACRGMAEAVAAGRVPAGALADCLSQALGPRARHAGKVLVAAWKRVGRRAPAPAVRPRR